jgi:hypothetical protein
MMLQDKITKREIYDFLLVLPLQTNYFRPSLEDFSVETAKFNMLTMTHLADMEE